MVSPFADDILIEVEPLYREISRRLENAAEDTIVPIPLNSQDSWFTGVSPTIQTLLNSYGLSALKLQLKHKMSPAHSGWLYNAFLDRLKALGEDSQPGNSRTTRVGLRVNGQFMSFGQFSLAKLSPEHVAYFAAVGPHSKGCLQGILDAESTFDPSRFDSDGYAII